MDTGLDGLVVVITGASGGIGWACAEEMIGEGCRCVLLAGRQQAELEARVAAAGWGESALCLGLDVRDPAAVDEAFATARRRFGRLDVLVVSAGVWPSEHQRLDQLAPARVRHTVEVNLLGAMWCCRAFLAELADTGPREDGCGASICLIGSTAGRFGEAGHADYAVTKAGLRGLTLTLKNEIVTLDPYARVNLVEPGWTVTPMATEALAEVGLIERVMSTTAVRQLGRARDVARTVLTLSSPALSRHTSGEFLTVAGGMEGRRLWREAEIDRAAIEARL
jgi:3-oxoacyl-[acyl-carrier protein] reductase